MFAQKIIGIQTVFTRSDGTESYYFNSQLFNKFMYVDGTSCLIDGITDASLSTNARRSDKTAENLTMQIDWTTPLQKIDALETCLNRWLETEKNRWYLPNTAIMLQNIKNMRHLECTIGILHNGYVISSLRNYRESKLTCFYSNWQDWGLHNARRTAFHAAVNYYCRQLGISNYSPVQPVQFTKSHELNNYQDEEDFMDPSFDADEPSPMPAHQQLPGAQLARKETYMPASMGFQPPPDKPVPGMRARKSKLGKKAVVRSLGADG